MKRPSRLRRLAAMALASVLLTPACGPPSDETLIRELLEATVARAQKGDVPGLERFFAPDYRDFEGRDVAATLRLVSGYLGRYRGVVIHLLSVRVEDAGTDAPAAVECEVVLSHGAAQALRKLIRFAGEYYRFRAELRKQGPKDWRYAWADWRPVGLSELFPESLGVLRELFPGL